MPSYRVGQRWTDRLVTSEYLGFWVTLHVVRVSCLHVAVQTRARKLPSSSAPLHHRSAVYQDSFWRAGEQSGGILWYNNSRLA